MHIFKEKIQKNINADIFAVLLFTLTSVSLVKGKTNSYEKYFHAKYLSI
jgi:hypothetical protein